MSKPVKPEDVLADGQEYAEFGGASVRKGSVAAFIGNVSASAAIASVVRRVVITILQSSQAGLKRAMPWPCSCAATNVSGWSITRVSASSTTTLVIMRGPSASSTTATLYGRRSAKAG